MAKRHEKIAIFPHMGEMQQDCSRTGGRSCDFHFPLTGEMQRYLSQRCRVSSPFISRSRARCNSLLTSCLILCMDFHFPLTGEMQRCQASSLTTRSAFISRSRARCNEAWRWISCMSAAFISRSRARCNGATFLPSNSACQEVHLREPAFAIFWNIDFSFRNRMFDVGSRQIA